MDPSVQFAHHARGCTIAAAKIDAGTVIYQNVTIGSNMRFNKTTNTWERLGNPVIGRKVIIADGAKILGPVIIGADSIIAAGAIITRDVPANSVAYGVNQVKPSRPTTTSFFTSPCPNTLLLLRHAKRSLTAMRSKCTWST
jgi:serine O-acetyltransferase